MKPFKFGDKKFLVPALITPLLMAPMGISAAELDIKVTNITSGLIFTPLLITGHAADNPLFHSGTPASAGLELVAESGSNNHLLTEATNAGAVAVNNPANGLLLPGDSVSTNISTSDNQMYLSIVGMILPSNDGFVGLDSWKIPTTPGTYSIRLNAYDAGTEANDELRASMPVPPPLASGVLALGTNGTGVINTIPNDKVHIHPGSVGDFNPTGGISDINAAVHRWLNPVAAVTVTVR